MGTGHAHYQSDEFSRNMSQLLYSFRDFDDSLPVHFLHIPKTGGSTFGFSLTKLANALGAHQVSVYAGSDITAPVLDRIVAHVREAHDTFGAHYFSTAHLPLATCESAFGKSNLIAILRDPVDRTMSNYCGHFASHNSGAEQGLFNLVNFCATAEELFDVYPKPSNLFDNLQVRMLADSPRFSEPCTTAMLEEAKRNLSERFFMWFHIEAMDFCTNLVWKLFGQQRPELETMNVTGDYRDALTQLMKDWAKRYNEYDLELYRALGSIDRNVEFEGRRIDVPENPYPEQVWSIIDPMADETKVIRGKKPAGEPSP